MGQLPSRKPSATSNRVAVLKRLSSHNIVIANQGEIARYLDGHAQLGKLLPRICAKVRKDFGAEVELALELYKDPEIDDRYLTLYVRVPEYDAEILQRIDDATDRFDQQIAKATGYLLITTDFRRPRGENAV